MKGGQGERDSTPYHLHSLVNLPDLIPFYPHLADTPGSIDAAWRSDSSCFCKFSIQEMSSTLWEIFFFGMADLGACSGQFALQCVVSVVF